MSVIFAIEDIFFHELRHLASLRVWVVVVVSGRQAERRCVSAHTNLERKGTPLLPHVEYTELFIFYIPRELL